MHILVVRFSSLGDVAMTVPVIKNLLHQHPQLHITIVSASFMEPLFEGLERCHFHPAYLKEKHKGIAGIFRLFDELRHLSDYKAVADLHSVLRSRLLTAFFRVNGTKVVAIDKGRPQKAELTRKQAKISRQLPTTHERYAAVFEKIGFPLLLDTTSPVYTKQPVPAALTTVFSSGKKIIGIAPFAQYPEKMYPLEQMRLAVQEIAAANNTVLLLGGGNNEVAVLQQWEEEIFGVFNIAGRFSLKDELATISNLAVMVSMDSANMHLASLYGIPVVSIWGATHRYAGFYGWGQDLKNIVEIDLYCRPCSVFGNKPCYRGDHACMRGIAHQLVVHKINAASK